MENSFVVIGEKVEDKLVLRIAKVLLLFSLKRHLDHPESFYAFFPYMDGTRQSDGIDKELGCISLR